MNTNYGPFKKYVKRPLDFGSTGDQYISFKDDVVLRQLNKKKLKFTEAASLFYLASSFLNCIDLINFDEFRYFNGIKSISGPNVFKGCSNLESITIPRSVTEVAPDAFEGCINLKTIKFINPNVGVPRSYFSDCPNVKIIPQFYGVGWDYIGIDFKIN